MVDRNLFPYDLAVVAIMKNEEPYVKEWIDYHLLAGVDHFFIYDNDSTAEFKEILQPYIDAGIVTYTFYGGKCRQMEAYIDAVKRFRFSCRYIAWIDGDEFIFPKSKPTIAEVVDEVLANKPNLAALVGNMRNYGSNHQDTADYTRGVLERFPLRDKNLSHAVKSIANPRRVDFLPTPHAAVYFEGSYAVNENRGYVPNYSNPQSTDEKIVMNHYSFKSREERVKKVQRGNADHYDNRYSMDSFSHDKFNDEFDNSILVYRDARRSALIPQGGGIETLFQSKQVNYSRLFNALSQNLLPTLTRGVPQNFYDGKLENFLTCLNLCAYLKEKLLDDKGAKIFEEMALDAIHKSLYMGLQVADIFLLIDEIPNILTMPYPVAEKIRETLLKLIPQVMMFCRMNNHWQAFVDLEHNLKMLQSFDTLKNSR